MTVICNKMLTVVLTCLCRLLGIYSTRIVFLKNVAQKAGLTVVWLVKTPTRKLSTCPTTAAAAAKSLQSCPTLCNPIDGSPPGSPVPGILPPGKNTGVGCHFLLQCMKVKSESEVAQSCPTLSDLMDYSLPGSSVHGIFEARVLEWVAIATFLFLKTLFSKTK